MSVAYLYRALVMLIAIPFHESAHAFVSWKLGDSTAKDYGRLTMNPIAHFDPVGALCLILCGVGWAKPVPTRAQRFENPKLGMAVTALAGPCANFILALLSTMVYKALIYGTYLGLPSGTVTDVVIKFFYYMLRVNLSLAVFNLIPVPPFDGSRILLTFLPENLYFGVMRYERFIMVAFFLLISVGLLDTPLSWLNYYGVQALDTLTGFVDMLFLRLM